MSAGRPGPSAYERAQYQAIITPLSPEAQASQGSVGSGG